MAEPEVLAAFPRRPLAVRTTLRDRLSGLITALLALACLAGAVLVGLSYGGALVQEAHIWETGRPEPARGSQWRCHIRFVLGICTVDIAYQAAPGQNVTVPMSALVIGSLDSNPRPLEVKVDPTRPGHLAASILVDERPSRWLALAVLCGGLLLLGGLLLAGGWALLRQARLWRALAREPNPIAVDVVDTKLVSSPGWAREYSFRNPQEGSSRVRKQRLRVLKGAHGVPPEQWRYEEPISLNTDGTRLLALSGPGGALLVPASFAPLVLTESETEGVTAAARAAALSPPRS